MPTYIGGYAGRRVASGGVGFGANGSDLFEGGEYLANTSSGSILTIANSWSFAAWSKPDELVLLGDIAGVGLGDQINLIRLVYDASGPMFAALIVDSAGSNIKLYRWTTAVVQSVWQHHLLTWDGLNLKLYYNGSALAPTSTPIDNSGTMTDTARDIAIATRVDSIGSNNLSGNHGHVAIWNSVLVANEALAIFNGKHSIDLRSNSGNYVSSANLAHYYRPGFDSQGREDLASAGLNLVDSTSTNSNIVADAPA